MVMKKRLFNKTVLSALLALAAIGLLAGTSFAKAVTAKNMQGFKSAFPCQFELAADPYSVTNN